MSKTLPENIDSITLASLSAASTQTTTTPNQDNFNNLGVKVIVDITAISGVGATLVVTIQGRDAVSGKDYTILASAGLTAVGTTVLTVYPGEAVAANVSASDHLPRTWNVKYVISGTTPSVTGTISASLLV